MWGRRKVLTWRGCHGVQVATFVFLVQPMAVSEVLLVLAVVFLAEALWSVWLVERSELEEVEAAPIPVV